MRCRVGITTNPEGRKQYWKRKHPTLRNWKILGRHKTKSSAQTRETAEAKRRGCDASPGGGGQEVATWHVYYFQH